MYNIKFEILIKLFPYYLITPVFTKIFLHFQPLFRFDLEFTLQEKFQPCVYMYYKYVPIFNIGLLTCPSQANNSAENDRCSSSYSTDEEELEFCLRQEGLNIFNHSVCID